MERALRQLAKLVAKQQDLPEPARLAHADLIALARVDRDAASAAAKERFRSGRKKAKGGVL